VFAHMGDGMWSLLSLGNSFRIHKSTTKIQKSKLSIVVLTLKCEDTDNKELKRIINNL